MHTVPAGYLRAFAETSGLKRHPHVWRFDRELRETKLISVRDACVCKDVYTLKVGTIDSDTTIETTLLREGVDAALPPVLQVLASSGTPAYWQWRDLSRFLAFQLARTPRMFQVFRDEGLHQGVVLGQNDPQLAMVSMTPFLEKWICGMQWTIWWNSSTLPFICSDNPATMWVDRGSGAEIGVGFVEPRLEILLPLTPRISFTAAQTKKSLESVLQDSPHRIPMFNDFHQLRVRCKAVAGIAEVVKFNQLTVSNAERYVYADSSQGNVRLFLDDLFFGRSGPVRRSDRKPIGTPVEAKAGN